MSIKNCCANFYQTDLVRLLFGNSMHPGGLQLTCELAQEMGIAKESRVLDIACGLGTTAIFLAKKFGCHVTGIDLGSRNIEEANRLSLVGGVSQNTMFKVGDAEYIDCEDEIFDYVLSECSFCLFPDKRKSSEEMYRVLKKQGKVGISDIVVRKELHHNIKEALSNFVCILEAKNELEYIGYLENAGFVNIKSYDKKQNILSLIDEIKKRLFAAELLNGLGKLNITKNIDLDKTKNTIHEIKAYISSDIISYALLIGHK